MGWEEICNEDHESPCAEYSCTVWKYDEMKDYWEQHECTQEEKDFKPFKWFRGHFEDNFTDEYIPFFDDNDEAIDAFLEDDEAVDTAHDLIHQTEQALDDLGWDVELDPLHGLIEQDDHEDMKDAVDSWFTMWAQGWMNSGSMRKGRRGD